MAKMCCPVLCHCHCAASPQKTEGIFLESFLFAFYKRDSRGLRRRSRQTMPLQMVVLPVPHGWLTVLLVGASVFKRIGLGRFRCPTGG